MPIIPNVAAFHQSRLSQVRSWGTISRGNQTPTIVSTPRSEPARAYNFRLLLAKGRWI
jgi:hypothetical protein